MMKFFAVFCFSMVSFIFSKDLTIEPKLKAEKARVILKAACNDPYLPDFSDMLIEYKQLILETDKPEQTKYQFITKVITYGTPSGKDKGYSYDDYLCTYAWAEKVIKDLYLKDLVIGVCEEIQKQKVTPKMRGEYGASEANPNVGYLRGIDCYERVIDAMDWQNFDQVHKSCTKKFVNKFGWPEKYYECLKDGIDATTPGDPGPESGQQ